MEVDVSLYIDGVKIDIRIRQGIGFLPDTMSVSPPPGFVAIPPVISVEEYEQGIVEIHEALIG